MSSAQKLIKIGAIAFAIFLIVSIFEGILFVFQICGGYNYDKKDLDFHEIYQNIIEIDIDISASKIILNTGENFEVNAKNVSNRLEARETNGKLIIKEKKHFFWSHQSGVIEVTIPSKVLLDRLKISSGAGKVELRNVTAKESKIGLGAGSLLIENSVFYETKIDSGAGEVKVNESILHNLDIDSGVGKTELKADILGTSKIECGIGEIHLVLPKESDYKLTLEKGIGNLEVNGKSIQNESTYGSGENNIKIEGGIGSIKIDFKE